MRDMGHGNAEDPYFLEVGRQLNFKHPEDKSVALVETLEFQRPEPITDGSFDEALFEEQYLRFV